MLTEQLIGVYMYNSYKSITLYTSYVNLQITILGMFQIIYRKLYVYFKENYCSHLLSGLEFLLLQKLSSP